MPLRGFTTLVLQCRRILALSLILLFCKYPFLHLKFCHLQLTRTSITNDVETSHDGYR